MTDAPPWWTGGKGGRLRVGPALRVLVCTVVLAAGTATAAVPAVAQVISRSREGRYSRPIRPGLPEYRGGFMFCRLWYDAKRRMPSGMGWSTDYPASEHNFMTRLEDLTSTTLSLWNDGMIGYAGVRATDPELFQCPFLFVTDPGSFDFSDEEVENLRTYLLKGGFLWADDMWGDLAWRHFVSNIGRVLPEYPIVELTLEHRLFSVQYVVKEIPQIPSIQHWRRSRGGTSEMGQESAVPSLSAIRDENGRILVLISHNTDIADGWEREGDEPEFFYLFASGSYGIGINVALWVMSH